MLGGFPAQKFGLNNIYSQKKHVCKYNTNGSDGKRNAYI